MVRNVKNQSGMTLVELMVAMIILSIGALAFVSVNLTTSKFHKQADTDDYAYALARDRLAVLQNGDLPLRWIDSISVEHEGIVYAVVDTVSLNTTNDTKSARVYVNWTSYSRNREISLSGYMNREMCPDVSSSSPSAILFSTTEIPRGAPAAHPLGRVKITDPDSADQHLLVLDSSRGDNKMFRLVHMNVQTAVHCTTAGDYSLVLSAYDCDNNVLSKTFTLTVPEETQRPYFTTSSKIKVPENRAHGTAIDTIGAYPDTVNFQIISQTHPVALALDAETGELTVEDDTLFNYETLSACSALVSVSNGGGADTALFEVQIQNVNEAPEAIHLSGALVHLVDPSFWSVGALTTEDPDTGDHLFSYYLTDTSGFFQLTLDTIKTTTKSPLVEGFYDIKIETVDPHGLSFFQNFTMEIRDTTSQEGDCGSIEEWEFSKVYATKGLQVHWGNNIYTSKWWTQSKYPHTDDSWYFDQTCNGDFVCGDFANYSTSETYIKGSVVYWKKNKKNQLIKTVYRAVEDVPTGNKAKPHKDKPYWEEIQGCE